jgi:murein DD-endopeptidase MepM/ murein hydrolase activator NlpD
LHRSIRILAALLWLASVASASADDASTLARGRELTSLFYERKAQALWSRMSSKMQGALGSAAGLEAFREQISAQLGDEVEVLEEKVTSAEGFDIYLRRSRWSRSPGRVFQVQWALDDSGKVGGFFVRPDPGTPAQAPAPTRFLDYKTQARLQLPFNGEWRVVWGGRTLEQNYHVVNASQRFAYDLLVVRDGKSHDGDGKTLAQYHCLDQPILAPANGTVVSAVDGLADQQPGTRDPAHPAGNHVILDLGFDEYAVLAHMKQGSVSVKAGDPVVPGQPIGRCGNSGNTTEPHLHFHLQNAPRFGEGEGLPAFFNDYVADGRPVPRGEPLRGERIRGK